MKFRVYNKNNLTMGGNLFPTYFKTKKEAIAYAQKMGTNAVLQKKIAYNWYDC